MKTAIAGKNFKPIKKMMIGFLTLLLALSPTVSCAQNEPDSAGSGVSGSSPGSEGMEDRESTYRALVRDAAKKGKTSREYIGSLLGLGMHYNRSERYFDAAKTMRQALAIIDAGSLKPTPPSKRVPEKIVETQHGNGVVSAQVIRTPMPYEEMMQELLPQLIAAELGTNELNIAEVHIKRLIAIKGPNEVADKMSLMSAYSSYAQLMKKRNRPKEAEFYQNKADEINKSFIPL